MPLLIPLEIIIPIALVIIIIVVITWIIYKKNKELINKINAEKRKFSYYKENIRILREKSNTPEDFIKINQLARDFFKEYLNLDYNLTYLDLKKEFEKNNKTDLAEFCNKISEINYSGKKQDISEISEAIEIFSRIINDF